MIVILIIGFLILFLEPYLISEFYKPKYLAWTGLYTGPTGSVDFYGFFPWSSSYIFPIESIKSIALSDFRHAGVIVLWWMGVEKIMCDVRNL